MHLVSVLLGILYNWENEENFNSHTLFTRIRIIIIPFYPKKVSPDRDSIHKYLDRLPILFTRSRIQFLSGQTLCG